MGRNSPSQHNGPRLAASSVVASASFTPAAAAYSAGDLVSVAQQFIFKYPNGVLVPAGAVIRIVSTELKIDQTALIASETSYTLQMYSVTPPSAQADNAAWTLASADLPSYRGSIDLGTPADLGAACYIKKQLTDLQDFNLAAGKTSLFGELITVGGPTFTAVARQVFLYGVIL